MTENPFDRGAAQAKEYDAWYDSRLGQDVLARELGCVRELLEGAPRPWLDLGTGSGRFGEGAGVEVGLDPAADLLRIAARRLPSVVLGVGEALPFRDASVGSVLSVTVFEFLADPAGTTREIRRVLRPGGRFVLGFFPQTGAWARAYREQGRDPASVFRSARFFSLAGVDALAREAGLSVGRVRCALFEAPGIPPSKATVAQWDPGAGFSAVELTRAGEAEGHRR